MFIKSLRMMSVQNGFVLTVLLTNYQVVTADEVMLKFDEILSADIVEQVSGREIREHRSHVWMSKHGLAVETKGVPGKSPRIIYLYNFKEDKSWIVSPEGQRYCELSKEENDSEINGGILSTKPCLGFESQKLQEMEWNDQVVTVWQCQAHQRDIAKHYYSTTYGVVVKEEAADGIIRELRDINRINGLDKDIGLEGMTNVFMPMSNYRTVTVNEFFFAKRPLEKYLE